jgi:hypothetical protein
VFLEFWLSDVLNTNSKRKCWAAPWFQLDRQLQGAHAQEQNPRKCGRGPCRGRYSIWTCTYVYFPARNVLDTRRLYFNGQCALLCVHVLAYSSFSISHMIIVDECKHACVFLRIRHSRFLIKMAVVVWTEWKLFRYADRAREPIFRGWFYSNKAQSNRLCSSHDVYMMA